MVKVKLVDPPKGMLAAPNALMITGCPATVMLAFAVLPVPPSVDVTCTLLVIAPTAVPVTFSETVQDAFAASVPPDKLTVPDPAAAEIVPPHELFNVGEVETIRPAGKVSEKAIPLKTTMLFGLLIVKVSEVEPFSGMLAAPKAFVIMGGAVTGAPPTPVSAIVSVLPLMPWLSSVMVTAPVTVLPWSPDTGANITLMVQLAPVANCAGQLSDSRKWPETEIPPISSGLFAFVSVTVCAGLLVLTACWPKSRLAVESPALGGNTRNAYTVMLPTSGVVDIPGLAEVISSMSA